MAARATKGKARTTGTRRGTRAARARKGRREKAAMGAPGEQVATNRARGAERLATLQLGASTGIPSAEGAGRRGTRRKCAGPCYQTQRPPASVAENKGIPRRNAKVAKRTATIVEKRGIKNTYATETVLHR